MGVQLHTPASGTYEINSSFDRQTRLLLQAGHSHRVAHALVAAASAAMILSLVAVTFEATFSSAETNIGLIYNF